jgi:ribosomal protein S18 acetylase RimI-like enzyme
MDNGLSLIEKGMLRKNKGLPSEKIVSYEMIFLEVRGCQEIADLQETILRCLPDREIFRTHPIEYLEHLFDTERSAIGVMTEGALVAYSLIRIPEKSEPQDNLGRDINLPEEELERVAHLQATVVHQAYRGNSLQLRMARHHINVLKEMGFCHLLCTISPKNPVSLRSGLSCGFVIKGLKRMFEGWWRYIMYQNILCPSLTPTFPGSDAVWVHSSDIEGQIRLIDKGFMGCGMRSLHDDIDVAYCRDQELTD